jgi:predicted porin
LFGEVAQTFSHGNALAIGTLASLTHSFDLALLYRSYERNFQTFYGNALSENSTAQNESGYYVGWKYKFDKQHTLAGYTDVFQFPWLRYRGYAPSNGHEWLARYAYQPNKEVILYIQVREESKIRNNSGDVNLYQTDNGRRRNLWINADYTLNPHLSFKSRAQFSSYSFNSSFTRGFALIQDVNLSVKKFTLSARYALFDTDDYDNRQYVYERDVWLAFTFPFYNGVGIRNYFLLKYSINKKIDLWLRWSRIKYVDRDQIGTGNEMINGNSVNDVKFQARISF